MVRSRPGHRGRHRADERRARPDRQARLLLTHVGRLEGKGRDEDQLAFLRTEPQYRNLTIVELPNVDFARTILRNFLVAAWQRELWQKLATSSDAELAAIAAKSLKETRYHLQHASDWTVRLGDGTEESHARMQRALDYLWPYTAEFFSTSVEDKAIETAAIGPAWSSARVGMGSRRATGARSGNADGADAHAVRLARQARPAHRVHGPPADRDAVPAAHVSGRNLVGPAMLTSAQAWDILNRVPDPEIPVISVTELGIVRDVQAAADGIDVVVTPTYSGCPATEVIERSIREALTAAGAAQVRVTTQLAPAWTTDWIEPAAQEKLRAYGIAPPGPGRPAKRSR